MTEQLDTAPKLSAGQWGRVCRERRKALAAMEARARAREREDVEICHILILHDRKGRANCPTFTAAGNDAGRG
jgi:hypothetical protein